MNRQETIDMLELLKEDKEFWLDQGNFFLADCKQDEINILEKRLDFKLVA